MLEPLEQWHCDMCGKIVNRDDGIVVWKKDERHRCFDFKIVHRGKCDPQSAYPLSLNLISFLGEEGLATLLGYITVGPIEINRHESGGCCLPDLDGFIDFFRRVQIPHYEEARRHFKDPDVVQWLLGSNEVASYLPGTLKEIVERFAKKSA